MEDLIATEEVDLKGFNVVSDGNCRWKKAREVMSNKFGRMLLVLITNLSTKVNNQGHVWSLTLLRTR